MRIFHNVCPRSGRNRLCTECRREYDLKRQTQKVRVAKATVTKCSELFGVSIAGCTSTAAVDDVDDVVVVGVV